MKKNILNVVQPQEYDPYQDPKMRLFLDAADKLIAEVQAKKEKEDAILAELGFKLTFDDVMALLKNEDRLKEVVSKLKLKVFW